MIPTFLDDALETIGGSLEVDEQTLPLGLIMLCVPKLDGPPLNGAQQGSEVHFIFIPIIKT